MSGLSILVFIIDMSQIHRGCCLCVGDLWERSAVRPEICRTKDERDVGRGGGRGSVQGVVAAIVHHYHAVGMQGRRCWCGQRGRRWAYRAQAAVAARLLIDPPLTT